MKTTATRIAALAAVLLLVLAASFVPRLQSGVAAPLGASAERAARVCMPCDTDDAAAPTRPAPSLHDAATFVLPLCGVA
jgi:hypothetical protein